MNRAEIRCSATFYDQIKALKALYNIVSAVIKDPEITFIFNCRSIGLHVCVNLGDRVITTKSTISCFHKYDYKHYCEISSSFKDLLAILKVLYTFDNILVIEECQNGKLGFTSYKTPIVNLTYLQDGINKLNKIYRPFAALKIQSAWDNYWYKPNREGESRVAIYKYQQLLSN